MDGHSAVFCQEYGHIIPCAQKIKRLRRRHLIFQPWITKYNASHRDDKSAYADLDSANAESLYHRHGKSASGSQLVLCIHRRFVSWYKYEIVKVLQFKFPGILQFSANSLNLTVQCPVQTVSYRYPARQDALPCRTPVQWYHWRVPFCLSLLFIHPFIAAFPPSGIPPSSRPAQLIPLGSA